MAVGNTFGAKVSVGGMAVSVIDTVSLSEDSPRNNWTVGGRRAIII